MPETGGPTTQSGTYFQNTVAAWFMARLLYDASRAQGGNRVVRVRCEAPEEIDDVVVTFERGIHYVQVKEALSASEAAWNGLWRHFWKQFSRIDPACDRLVLWGGQHTELFHDLQEMTKRVQSVPRGPRRRQVSESVGRLSKKQSALLDAVLAIIREYESQIAFEQKPGEVTYSDIFDLLQVVDVIVKGSAEEIEAQATNTFLSGAHDARAVFAVLRDLAADKARTRGSWDHEGLRAALAERGVRLDVQHEPEVDNSSTIERRALEQELKIHRRNLATLRQQAAIYGAGAVHLHLVNQIEYEEAAIREIESKLGD